MVNIEMVGDYTCICGERMWLVREELDDTRHKLILRNGHHKTDTYDAWVEVDAKDPFYDNHDAMGYAAWLLADLYDRLYHSDADLHCRSYWQDIAQTFSAWDDEPLPIDQVEVSVRPT